MFGRSETHSFLFVPLEVTGGVALIMQNIIHVSVKGIQLVITV